MANSVADIPAVLIVAAGRGMRAGGGTPKQYRLLGGRMVLTRTIERFIRALPSATICCVIHPDDRALYNTAIAGLQNDPGHLAGPVDGGPSRQDSVRAGLEALSSVIKLDNIVLIHDSVRCFSDIELIEKLVREAAVSGAAIPGYPIPDALKYASADGLVTGAAERDHLYAVQTPQVFDLALILGAHEKASQAGVTGLADDAAVANWAGHQVKIIKSDGPNIKLTTTADFQFAEMLLMNQLSDIRTGTGFDVHAFAEGDHLWLGGIRIDHERSLSGHSDADVALHALTDAILGAIADGDIGSHFPPSDPQWKGAASDQFLRHAVTLTQRRGGEIAHLDLTIIAEEPRIGPHREAMRASIAAICGIALNRVSVKATTTEKLGFTGRREGIAAQAQATIRLPAGGSNDG
jgi:2-C-methyl-D-erythritol 4-phosphate cytidylyltransferase/2-C-methyl-D-erythritol 2,4-cyclodiphosphate synthase